MARKKQSKKLSQLIFSEKPKEITDGIITEKLSPVFFDSSKLKIQPEPVYRLDANGYRYYYIFRNEEPVFFTSVTTMIKNTLPTSPHLIKWMVERGEDSKDEAEERANYGTFLHTICGQLLINGKYDLEKLPEQLSVFCIGNNIQAKKDWVTELKKDVLAFAQFMIDFNVEPLAIEIILWHPTDGYAGALDIVCGMDWEIKGNFGEVYASGANKGQPKETKKKIRVRAIVDIKSGRKGFYESSEIQLKSYQSMWNIHFPDYPIDMVLNWSPKDWKSTPSYNLKDQTSAKSAEKLPYLVQLAKIEESRRENKVSVLKGTIDLTKGLSDNISELTLADLIKQNK